MTFQGGVIGSKTFPGGEGGHFLTFTDDKFQVPAQAYIDWCIIVSYTLCPTIKSAAIFKGCDSVEHIFTRQPTVFFPGEDNMTPQQFLKLCKLGDKVHTSF